MRKLWGNSLVWIVKTHRTTILQPRRVSKWFSTSASLPILTLYTKDVCSLCDEAKVVLESYKHRFHFEEVDITAKENQVWFDKYRYEIPVFHLNGAFLMKHRVDEELLEKELRKCEMERVS